MAQPCARAGDPLFRVGTIWYKPVATPEPRHRSTHLPEQGFIPDMDQVHPPGAAELSAAGPHLKLHPDVEQSTPRLPLKLVLEPSGAVLEIDKPDTLIGRHSDADIRLPLPDVSRRHCRVQWSPGGWQVIDLNSLNGIQVNGEQVQQSPLADGDRLRIGGFIFTVDLSGGTGETDKRGHVDSILKTLANAPRHAS
jgi:hypothetical protein